MKRRSPLLALSVLALALACENSQRPTGVRVPTDPSRIIDDGAHGGNQDFFFLPPLVPLPTAAHGFEAGEFNNALRASITVEICRLKPDKLDNLHLPTPETPCYENGPFYNFAAGSVNLVNNPVTQTGWWTGLNLPSDGFYYVRWDTRAAQLNPEKFYRVRVLIAGSTVPLGVVDIDPMKRSSEFQATRMANVVQILDDDVVSIPFRVENRALCGGALLCTSSTVTNNNPNGETQVVTVEGGAGAIAGASFPNGWLPEGGPQSVVVTIAEVPSPEHGNGSRTRTIPCHVGLPFQQFNKCFEFTTTPPLADISPTVPGVQFALDVKVAVCYALEGSEDAREESAQLYASDTDEPPHPLEEVDDDGILGPGARDCFIPPVITLESSNPVTLFASRGWRGLKGGLTQLFGVKTAYALDGGLGGIVKGFSRIGAALTAEIEPYPHAIPIPAVTALPLVSGVATPRARIIGSHSHGPGENHGAKDGINEVPVIFTVASGNGTLSDGEGDGQAQVTVMTGNFTDEVTVKGIAEVEWTPPTVPGIYTLTATGPTKNTVTFKVTVPAIPPGSAATIDGVMSSGEWADATVYGPYAVNLPSGATTATLYLKNTATELFGAVSFGQNLTNHPDVILALRMDLNANGDWDNNEDGAVVHQRIGGESRNTFFDEYASCVSNVCNEAMDSQNDGSTASTDDGTPTVVEFAKGINNTDVLDATLSRGQTLRFFFFTNIGTGPNNRSETYYPSPRPATASYTVR